MRPRYAPDRPGAAWPLARPEFSGGAALRPDHGALVIGGPINGTSGRAYVAPFLVPTLSRGDVAIVDNLDSHKGQAVRRLIRAAGATLLFLPRYSPDLDPIEQVFAKLSTTAGHRA